MWDDLTLASLLSNKQSLCDKYSQYLYNLDVSNCKKSSTLQIHPSIKLKLGTQEYLSIKLPVKICRVLAQVRLLNTVNSQICIDNEIYKFNDQEFCHLYNQNKFFLHMLIDCEYFVSKRKSLELPLTENYNLDFFQIMENPNYSMLNKLLAFIKHILHCYKR